MKKFWQDLRKKKSLSAKATKGQAPFFALAPMEDVTDTVFRRVVTSVAAPDVYFTEFASVEGILSIGSKHVGRRLEFTELERPLIAQIWGIKPENYYEVAKMLVAKGFDGIDINMGCPDKSVTAIGACSALIKNKSLAKEIIQAVKEGIRDAEKEGAKMNKSEIRSTKLETNSNVQNSNDQNVLNLENSNFDIVSDFDIRYSNLPVSVKTRIGYSAIQTEEWTGFLLEQDIDALSIHGRTVREMSKVPAHWDEIAKVVSLRDQMKKETVIIGNGDVKSMADGKEKAATTGVDGIMIGRGIFENIWIFKEDFDHTQASIAERIEILLYHLKLYDEQEGEKHAFHTLKKFFKIYVRDFDGASELRSKLMEAKTTGEVREILLK